MGIQSIPIRIVSIFAYGSNRCGVRNYLCVIYGVPFRIPTMDQIDLQRNYPCVIYDVRVRIPTMDQTDQIRNYPCVIFDVPVRVTSMDQLHLLVIICT